MADIQTQRVQSIASLSLCDGTIPTQFVRLEHEQPGITTCHGPLLEVPVLDFAEQDEEKLVRSVHEASREWGFFQITGHGIPDDVIVKLQKVGREFFESPPEEKEKYAKVPGSSSLEGYGTMLQKEMAGKIGWVDHLFHKIWPPSSINHKFWPRNPSTYREANEEYAKCLHGVADKLLKTLSLGLGLDEDELKVAVGGDELVYLLKINYYPPCPRPDLALGVVAHTDMSAMTILVPNEIQGLQLYRDDHWHDVQYVPGALIVHIGDQLEIVSNGEYKAVLHRTKVNKEKTRMSWPVFLDPPSELEVGPHPKLVTDEKPAKYKTKKYQDYAHCKLNKIPQ